MKLIIFKALLIFAVITTALAAPHSSHSDSSNSNETDSNSSEEAQFTPSTKLPLKKWFEELNKQIEASSIRSGISKFTKNVDQNCVKDKIKMTENGNKKVNLAQAVVSIGIGYLKCYDKSENAAIIEGINDFLELYESTNFFKYGDCYLNELKKLEPTSKLVENFDVNGMELTEEECSRHLGEDTYQAMMKNLEEYTGDLATFTCGNFKADDFKLFGMKLVILSFEKNDELKEAEIEKLRETVGSKLNNIFDCVMQNM